MMYRFNPTRDREYMAYLRESIASHEQALATAVDGPARDRIERDITADRAILGTYESALITWQRGETD